MVLWYGVSAKRFGGEWGWGEGQFSITKLSSDGSYHHESTSPWRSLRLVSDVKCHRHLTKGIIHGSKRVHQRSSCLERTSIMAVTKRRQSIISLSCHKYHFCRDKSFVATNTCLSRHKLEKIMFVATKQNFCHKHNFVATEDVFCFVATKSCLSQQT